MQIQTFLHHNTKILVRFIVTMFASLLLALSTAYANNIDPKLPPAEFIEKVGNNALQVVIDEQDTIRAGDISAINKIVEEHVLPYINLEKTTRLAVGRHWRQATEQQRSELVAGFMNTLIRTYSGAFKGVDKKSKLTILPFRGNPEADDVVVKSTLSQRDAPTVAIDYRMEKTPDGWKIYDINVEGIWLIQNYRNQFAEEISRSGIDGLIKKLKER